MKLRQKPVILLLLGLALGLLGAELAARLALGSPATLLAERAGAGGGFPGPATGLREEGQFERTLSLHPFWGYGGRAGRLAVNRFGFFSGKEVALCGARLCLAGAQPGDLVVGVFGGSLALQVASDEAGLEAALAPRFPGRRVRVVSFALPGHAAPQTFAAYQYFRDVVNVAVFLDGLNEIWNPVRNNQLGYPPVFAKAEHFRLLSGEAEGDRRRIERLRERIQGVTNRSLQPVWRHLALSHVMWKLERGYLQRRIAELGGAEGGATGAFFAAGEAELVALGAGEWVFAHQRASHLAEVQGAGFVHLLQPTPFASARRLTAAEQQALAPYGALAALVRLGYPQLRARAKALGVRDLTAMFDGVEGDLWIDGAHLGPRGLELLRAEVASRVGELGRDRPKESAPRAALKPRPRDGR